MNVFLTVARWVSIFVWRQLAVRFVLEPLQAFRQLQGGTAVNVFLTVMSGVLIFVGGQLVVRFVLEPLQAFRQLLGEISVSILYYRLREGRLIQAESVLAREDADLADRERAETERDQVYKDIDEARDKLRRQSFELLGRAEMVPAYGFWAVLGCVPGQQKLVDASYRLTGLSNATGRAFGSAEMDKVRGIAGALRLRFVSARVGQPENVAKAP